MGAATRLGFGGETWTWARAAVMGVALAMAAVSPARAGDATADAAKAAPKPTTAKAKSKSRTKTKKAKASPASTGDGAQAQASKRRHVGVSPAYIVGDNDAHLINEAAPDVVPFGADAPAVKKAFAETRREQIADAEKAARADKTPDRWRTVLFMLHPLPERTDSEVCFWRVLSFYRLGEIDRARKIREGCELPAKDSSFLNREDARVSGTPSAEDLQQAALLEQQGASAADAGAEVLSAQSPYTGPSPQRQE